MAQPSQVQDNDQLGRELTEHVAALRRYARALTNDPTEADDLVQECLSRVLAQMRAWREVRELKQYLFSTLHNIFIDTTRRRRSRPTMMPLNEEVATISQPANQTKRLEARDMVRALGELPATQREVVLLVGVEGMSYSDVSKVLDVPIGTVMSRLSRGRDSLRRLMSHGKVPRLRLVR